MTSKGIYVYKIFFCFSVFGLGCANFGYAWSIMPGPIPAKPKLIIGIVIDQMRVDFLYRYYSKYCQGGFKRLMTKGFNNRNTHYPYVPTVTAAGHSCIFTGTIPAINGMVGNDWYSRSTHQTVYCTADSSVHAIGGSEKAGHMSPKNLLVTTITDQLRLASNFKSKVIGIAEKDRASILPAGHAANAAYWFDSQSGNFMTSSYYVSDLPPWVKTFNAKHLAAKYLSAPWTTLLPMSAYSESSADDVPWEAGLRGEPRPVFPHQLNLGHPGIEVIQSTPFGNSLTKDFALASIEGERLGKSGNTDFLTLSFSSTDYVGHAFGPNSVEIEDTYLRLDKDLEELLTFLDHYLGKENILVFLSADHGVAGVPGYNAANKLPGGVLSPGIENELRLTGKRLTNGADVIESIRDEQLYLNDSIMQRSPVSRRELLNALRKQVLLSNGLYDIVDLQELAGSTIPQVHIQLIKNGYYAKRSGDFQLITEPSWFVGGSKGTTHGTGYSYDTHVPLIWYGWKVRPGSSSELVSVTDIAPTLADMLDILEPSGSFGRVIMQPGK